MALHRAIDADIALVGTGLAPLLVAKRLIEQGVRVVVLNPDLDFFLEDSELPFDPDWRVGFDEAQSILRPDFPGPLDDLKPKNRVWLSTPQTELTTAWERFESFFLEASEFGQKPVILDGPGIQSRFPGAPRKNELLRGLQLPKLWSLNVENYRFSILEFVRERLGAAHCLVDVSNPEPMPDGIRFYHQGESATARVSKATLVFWTPRLTSLVQAWGKRWSISSSPIQPGAKFIWNSWSLVSREPIGTEHMGVLRDSWIWAQASRPFELRVMGRRPEGTDFDLEQIEEICLDLLSWEKFSIRSYRDRILFDWSPSLWKAGPLQKLGPQVWVAGLADGPVQRVVQAALTVAHHLEERTP